MPLLKKGIKKNIFNYFFREKYESFLSSVEILKGMDGYERSKIADALKEVTCKQNTKVIT